MNKIKFVEETYSVNRTPNARLAHSVVTYLYGKGGLESRSSKVVGNTIVVRRSTSDKSSGITSFECDGRTVELSLVSTQEIELDLDQEFYIDVTVSKGKAVAQKRIESGTKQGRLKQVLGPIVPFDGVSKNNISQVKSDLQTFLSRESGLEISQLLAADYVQSFKIKTVGTNTVLAQNLFQLVAKVKVIDLQKLEKSLVSGIGQRRSYNLGMINVRTESEIEAEYAA